MNDRTTAKRGTRDGRDFRRRLVLGTALATSAFFGGYRGYIRRAFAGCAATDPGIFTCSGTATTTQNLSGSPLSATTEPGFSIDTTVADGDAIFMNGNGAGGLTFTDNNQSTITGGNNGIYALTGGGMLSITTTGAVKGGTDYGGITARNINGTGLTISMADASGGRFGISAVNEGGGALSIKTTGTVTATGGSDGISGDGIFALNHGGDLTVDAVAVSGVGNGVYAWNQGTGKLSITATGAVAGANANGIAAANDATGTDLTISAAVVSGGTRGIFANNSGTGALSITTTGAIEGKLGEGIYARNYGTDLTIETTADVTGAAGGIFARNEGAGALSITAEGTVQGGTAKGVYALNNNGSGTDLTVEAVNVSGAADGIFAHSDGKGKLSISTSGAVTGGTGYGIYARNVGTDLTITADGDVSGGNSGITGKSYGSGALAITASGTVEGVDTVGIFGLNGTEGTDATISAAAVSSNLIGIAATNAGTGALSISASKTVTGENGYGIFAANSGKGTDLTISTAAVNGGVAGIAARNSGSGTLSITAGDTVTGGGYGIMAFNGAPTYDTGADLKITATAVSGGASGIKAHNYGSGMLSIAATGEVTGTKYDGIYARNEAGSYLKIAAANVSGGRYGIRTFNNGSGELSITASGTVTGTSRDGIAAVNGTSTGSAGTNLTIDTYNVSGARYGIVARNFGSGVLSIAATGTVAGAGADGIYAYAGGNATGLTISAVDVSAARAGIDAINNGGGALSITATGAVAGTTSTGIGISARNNGTDLMVAAAKASGVRYGIYAINNGSGVLSITATDSVEAGIWGVYARNYGTDLTIKATGISGGYYGIRAHNHGVGALEIAATGTVTGGSYDGIRAVNGAYADGAGTDLTIAAYNVSGGNYGIFASNFGSGALSITTTGTVTGTNSAGIFAGNDTGSNATDLTIVAANVSGGTDGIFAANDGSGVLSITTTGAVTGGSGNGIYALNGSASTIMVTVEGASAVSGATAGVRLVSPTGQAASLANAGSIIGATGVIVSGGPATLSNTGSIAGAGGPAIDLTGAGGVSTVNQQGGTIAGAILLSAAADTVNVTGGAIAGDIVGQGSAVTNFALGSGSFSFAEPFAITGMADVAMNSGTVAIAGTIDTDALTVNGGSMTIAGAVNTPVFRLNGGVLSVSSDANLGSGAGALTFDGGTFENTAAFATTRDITLNAGGGAFQTDADLTVASGIAGSGGLIKTGAAALTLNGVNSFTGLTTINEGKLVVGDDSHAAASLAGAVLVNSGGTLGGIGTVGSTTIASGGTIAPGNSIGTLTVRGDISFASGSTYVAEINPALDSDLIDASGKATIEGGTVYAAKVAGVYTPDSRWTIVGADGGVTGTFDTLDQNMPFVDLALAYDANHVYIDATRNEVAFCDVAMTFNQCSTGNGLESTGVANPVYDAVAALPDGVTARYALDQLSGEIYASTKSALIEESHFVRDAVNDRIRSAFGDATASDMPVLAYGPDGARQASPDDDFGAVGWGRAFGSWGSFDGDGNAAGMDTSTGGFFAGIDAPLTPNWRLGFIAGYSRSSFHVDDRASSGNSNNYHLGLYTGGEWNALRLSGGLAYTWHDIETSRSVVFPGFSDRLSGDYDAGTFQVFGEAGYRIDAGTIAFEPFANLAYVSLHTDGLTEKGGAAALHVRGETNDTTFTTLGVHLSSAFTLGGMKATAHGTLGWRHAYGDTTPFVTQAFAGGEAFDIAGVPIARDAAIVDAGLDLDLTKAATLGLAYQGQFGSGAMQNGFKADLSVRF